MLAAVLPQNDPIAAAYAASWGVLVAGVCQAALLLVGRAPQPGRGSIRPAPKLTPEIKALIGAGHPRRHRRQRHPDQHLHLRHPGQRRSTAARSWLTVADRLYQLPLGLVGVAIGVALLPRLSTRRADRRPRRRPGGHGPGHRLRPGAHPAGRGGADGHALLPDRRPLHPRRVHRRRRRSRPARLLFHYGWGVPAFVLIADPAAGLLRPQDTKDADALRPDLGGGEHRAGRRPCSTPSASRASPSPPPSPPGSTCSRWSCRLSRRGV